MGGDLRAVLCQAATEGDLAAAAALSDLLEEQGDPRCKVLRRPGGVRSLNAVHMQTLPSCPRCGGLRFSGHWTRNLHLQPMRPYWQDYAFWCDCGWEGTEQQLLPPEHGSPSWLQPPGGL